MKKFGGKQVLAGALSAAMVLGSAMPALAATGWNQDTTGWWWENSDGSYVVNNWVQDAGKWYFMDGNGYMSRGWIWDNGTWYFADASGAMLTGWVRVDGSVYYLNPVSDGTQGAMVTGTRTIDGVEYTFDASGACMNSTSYNRDEIPSYYGNGSVAVANEAARGGSGGGSSSSSGGSGSSVSSDVQNLNSQVNTAVSNATAAAEAAGVVSSTDTTAPISSISVSSGTNTATKTITVNLREEQAAATTLADVSESFVPAAEEILNDENVTEITYNGNVISKDTAQSMLNAAAVNDTKTLDTLADSYTVQVKTVDGGTVTYTFHFN